MVTEIWVNIGSGNGLLPRGTRPLNEPMLIFIGKVLWHSSECNFIVSAQATILYTQVLSLKIRLLKLSPHFAEANELIYINFDFRLKITP